MRLGAKRIFNTTKQKSEQAKRWSVAVVFILALFCLFLYAVNVLRPAFVRLAETKAKNLALSAIHQTVWEQLSKDQRTKDMVSFTKAEDNRITAVTSDLAEASRLKSQLNLEILKAIEGLNTQPLSVPLGSLMGNEFFYGLGPNLSFRIKPYGTVETDVVTSFTEAGINQTKCDVAVDVSCDISVLMPTVNKKHKVKTTVPILETVIVGDVPESYTNVDREGLPYEDDVLQLAE